MVKTVFLLLLATLLCANPKVYSALGDVIYDNVQKIEGLKSITEFKNQQSKIDEYVKSVYEAKEVGFNIEIGTKEIDKKEYLSRLRKLSKIYDSFLRSVQNSYEESMQKENTLLWSKLINSELIDVSKHKDEILEFYFAHSDDIDEQGTIEKLLEQEDKKIKTQNSKNNSSLIKKETQEEKIKRIRQKDQAKQKAISEALEEELMKKKSAIRNKQEKELFKPN